MVFSPDMAMQPPFAELAATTNYSFLRGASSPGDMVRTAIALGHAGIGIADRNSVAGVVRAHVALREANEDSGPLKFKLIVGARLGERAGRGCIMETQAALSVGFAAALPVGCRGLQDAPQHTAVGGFRREGW